MLSKLRGKRYWYKIKTLTARSAFEGTALRQKRLKKGTGSLGSTSFKRCVCTGLCALGFEKTSWLSREMSCFCRISKFSNVFFVIKREKSDSSPIAKRTNGFFRSITTCL